MTGDPCSGSLRWLHYDRAVINKEWYEKYALQIKDAKQQIAGRKGSSRPERLWSLGFYLR